MIELETLEQVDIKSVGGVKLSRLQDATGRISMLVPNEWAVGRAEKFETVYIGPNSEGLQTNLGIAHTELLRGNKLTVELLGKQVLEFIKGVYQDVEIVSEREVELDGTRPGLLRSFNWTDPTKEVRVTQTMLLVVDSNTLYDMTATMAKSATPEFGPVVEAMLLSVRFLASPVNSN